MVTPGAVVWRCVCLVAAFACAALAAGAAEARAKVTVSGAGSLQNRALRETLKVLEPEEKPLPVLDAAFVEDAVIVLQSALERQGYLRPAGVVHLEQVDGTRLSAPWSAGTLPEVARDMQARAADFELRRGTRFYFDALEFVGLESVDPAQARAYFLEEGFLFGGRQARRFTPDILEQGCDSLREQLRREGRAGAQVEVEREVIDEDTGAASVIVRVAEGPLHRAGIVRPVGDVPGLVEEEVAQMCAEAAGAVYSPLWRQDLVQTVRAELFLRGFANAEVRLEPADTHEREGEVVHDLALRIDAGPQVQIIDVTFEGDDRTRRSILRRATRMRPGDLFDRSIVEDDRLQLSRLGAFSAVRAQVQEVEPDEWNLIYQLRPGKRLEAGVLAGYGSYEQLRGGLEVFHGNQLGYAERGRLQLVESTKSTSAEYQLTVPQVLGTRFDASARAFGLAREEVSFDREEYGASAGLRRHIERFGVDVALRYQFESLRAKNIAPDLVGEAPADSRVASLTIDITMDRRDNPLAPRAGHLLGVVLETAATAIGGEVDYERLELKAAWHREVGRGRWVHLGFRHGVLWSLGSSTREIPIGRRFYPGGEGTLRGYREGRAAPRGELGEVIGAEVSTIANIEFEQALLSNLSAVVFVDAGLTAAEVGRYPGNQTRVSAGIGLRYNSVIGPARLEYGHNIVRESGDQKGALHFALGFPF